MSKYIKLEDAIEQVKTEFYGGGYQEWLEISIDNLINRIANLPTIEVSEDCVSREWLKSFEYINKGDFNSVETIREWIDNAPSVVPTTEQSSMVGEWVETPEGTMCGNCHKFPYDDGEYHIANWHSDYCPNCGAKMKV